MNRLEAIRARTEAGPTIHTVDSHDDVLLLLAVAEAAAMVMDWLTAAYPPASPLDGLRDALRPLLEPEP